MAGCPSTLRRCGRGLERPTEVIRRVDAASSPEIAADLDLATPGHADQPEDSKRNEGHGQQQSNDECSEKKGNQYRQCGKSQKAPLEELKFADRSRDSAASVGRDHELVSFHRRHHQKRISDLGRRARLVRVARADGLTIAIDALYVAPTAEGPSAVNEAEIEAAGLFGSYAARSASAAANPAAPKRPDLPPPRRRLVRACRSIGAEYPTAAWTAQQIVDPFPDDSAPSYLLRDRDQVYGQQFRHRVKGMGIDEVLTAPHSPSRILWPSASSVRSGASA